MVDKATVTQAPVLKGGHAAWYKELNAGHWRVLMASFLGWVFDGYENYALFLVAAPALRNCCRRGNCLT